MTDKNMTQMLANQRLRLFVNYLKVTGRVRNDADFAAKIGCSRTYASDILRGRTCVSPKYINDIRSVFPELNSDYLTDENCNQMLTGENSSTNIINSTIARNGQVTIGNRTITSDDIAAIIKNFEERCEDKERVIINLQQQIERLTGIIAAMASGNDKA